MNCCTLNIPRHRSAFSSSKQGPLGVQCLVTARTLRRTCVPIQTPSKRLITVGSLAVNDPQKRFSPSSFPKPAENEAESFDDLDEGSASLPAPAPSIPIPQALLREFEQKLEGDVQTVGITLAAIVGVIVFWRGVWALLDYYVGDSVFGDLLCVSTGLFIVMSIRLSGTKLANFWPPA